MMSELEDKIEELQKALKLLNKPDMFVPALKAPSIKSPAVLPSKTAKVPGLPSPSKKDPIKMAEQLRNPQPGKVKVEILKTESNGQWRLDKTEDTPGTTVSPTVTSSTTITQPGKTAGVPSPARQARQAQMKMPVSAAKHGFGSVHHTPEQNSLVEGINLNDQTPLSLSRAANAFEAKSESHPHSMVVKNAAHHYNPEERGHTEGNFNSAKREVLFHNMARDYFGLGKHVPLTAGFTKNGEDYSAQKKVEDAGHLNTVGDIEKGKPVFRVENPNHEAILKKLHGSGDLDKMAIMDHIMGHHDRHGKNYMLDNKGDNLHLIDNGTAFDYVNFDKNSVPAFHKTVLNSKIKGMGNVPDTVHPAAKEWLNSLSSEKAKKLLAAQGYPEDATHVKGFLNRLNSLKEAVDNDSNKDRDLESLLHTNRLRHGKMYPHPGNEST